MSKLLNVYENNIDKCWFDSSNIYYGECDDKNNELKEVKIIFKNGRTYLYENVKVQDWLLFRESNSNGKALTKYITKYEFKRLEDSNIDDLELEKNKIIEETLNEKQEENIHD